MELSDKARSYLRQLAEADDAKLSDAELAWLLIFTPRAAGNRRLQSDAAKRYLEEFVAAERPGVRRVLGDWAVARYEGVTGMRLDLLRYAAGGDL